MGVEDRLGELEKRLGRIEKAIEELKAGAPAAEEPVQDAKTLLERLENVEDVSLVDKLETLQNKEETGVILSSVDELSKKVDLLSDAVKILGRKGRITEVLPQREVAEPPADIKERVETLEAAMTELVSGPAEAGAVPATAEGAAPRELEAKVGRLEKSLGETNRKIDGLLGVIELMAKKRVMVHGR